MDNKDTKTYLQNYLGYLTSIHNRHMLAKVRPHHIWHGLIAGLQWKLGHQKVFARPLAFRIEPSAVCNLRCPLCSTTWRAFSKGQQTQLTLDNFKRIFGEIRKSVFRLTFYMEGEPLLNPKLFEMVRYATSRASIFTSLSSNFTLLGQHRISDLLRSGLDFISISLDGFRQETYQRYRVGGNVADVLSGIKETLRQRRMSPKQKPFVEVNMIRFKYVEQSEQDQLREFCEQSGVDRFVMRPEQFGLWGDYQPHFERRPSKNCYWAWISMSIDADGSAYVCPIAFEQKLAAGNLLKQSLSDIWNGDVYQATRKYLREDGDKREGLPRLPCFDCRWFGKVPATNPVAVRRDWLKRAGLSVLVDEKETVASKAE